MERGTHTHQGGGYTFVTFRDGQFVERVQAPTETSKSRLLEKGDNKGKEVHEEHYDSITGRLLDVTLEDGKFGKVWMFKMDVGTEDKPKVFILQFGLDFGLAMGILTRLKNCDLQSDMKIAGYYFVPKGEEKAKQGIVVYQSSKSKAKGLLKGDAIKVDPYYSAESAEKLPQWKQVTVNGKAMWDKTDETNFVVDMINKDIKPLLSGSTSVATQPAQTAQPTAFADSDDTADELPF